MPDYSALTSGFQQGGEFALKARQARQNEKMRDQMLEQGNYDLEAARDFRKVQNPDAMGVLGADYAAGNDPWGMQLQDPFAFQLQDRVQGWLKSAFGKGKKKKTQAIETTPEQFDSSSPVAADYNYGIEEESMRADGGRVGYADGGIPIEERMTPDEPLTKEQIRDIEKRNAREARSARWEKTKAGARELPGKVDKATGEFMNVRPKEGQGFIRRNLRSAKGAGALGALVATGVDAWNTPTEEYRKRFGLELGPDEDPSLLGELGIRTLGAASDLGNVLTFGLADNFYRDKNGTAPASGRTAIPPPAAEGTPENPMQLSTTTIRAGGGGAPRRSPVQQGPQNPMVNFGDIDMDPKEVPNMQTDDWKRYRAQMIAAAQKSGRPEAVQRVNDQVTQMQMQGFMNYGKQGLLLQQAGNLKGAMAAYRAAFQYMPNGVDVEFGTAKDKRTGQMALIGFGKDEKTGKVIPGSEIIMHPERVSTMLENFTNPQAWRMWAKDEREFAQKLREYDEVGKPLAEVQGSAALTNARANMLQAENYGLYGLRGGAGGIKSSDVRATQEALKGELMNQGVTDPTEALQLSEIAIRYWQAHPELAPDTALKIVLAEAKRLQGQPQQ